MVAFWTLLAFSAATVHAQEVYSDLADVLDLNPEARRTAEKLKAEKYWSLVSSTAEVMKLTDHVELYKKTEKVIASLPPENEYVREALTESLRRLKAADEKVLRQAVESSALAADQLSSHGNGGGSWQSFFSGSQSFMQSAIRHFLSGGGDLSSGSFSDQVAQRQADTLPMLRGAAEISGNVLSDTRLATKRCFDVLKYNLYNKGTPKTPKEAEDVANSLIEASGATRKRFTSFITQTVNSIREDYEGRHDEPSAVTAQHSMNTAALLDI
mmetsp:Transcript_24497/g.53282  ORF Transcript_24497/g.53282 Transcript_24497/m.53282 type:complete len:270 (-) Transcript_24497:178-987(-)